MLELVINTKFSVNMNDLTKPFKRLPVALVGTGSYVPERRLTNEDLEKMVDTSNEWIVTRTGIEERRIAAARAFREGLAALENRSID